MEKHFVWKEQCLFPTKLDFKSRNSKQTGLIPCTSSSTKAILKPKIINIHFQESQYTSFKLSLGKVV